MNQTEPRKTRITYGQLPTLQYYRLRYGLTFQSEGKADTFEQGLKAPFHISHGLPDRSGGVRPAERDYNERELWAELKRLVAIGNGTMPGYLDSQREEALSWASDILSSLGMEWV